MGYVSRHWRGELPLPVAFWINNFLLLIPLGIGVGMLMTWAQVWGERLETFARVGLAVWVLLAFVSIWAPVGAWRSATRHVEEGGSSGWASVAKFFVGLSLIGSVLQLGFDLVTEIPDQWKFATGRDPIGQLNIQLSEDGRSISLSGPFGVGAATRFRETMAKAPEVRRVLLDSPGGRLFEAHEIAKVVKQRNVQTRAVADCASACTLVFLAGSKRHLGAQARLGFHRASAGSMNPLHDEFANRKLRELYEEIGLPQYFISQVLHTSANSMWFPRPDALTTAGILLPPTLELELDPLMPANAPVGRYRDALSDNLLWAELERRQPGLLDTAAERMLQARLRGVALDAAVLEADAVAMAATPVVLRTSGSRSQEAYLQMLATELRERRSSGDASCQAVLKSDEATMPARLRGWMQEALSDSGEMDPQATRPLSALEREVLRRELGPGVFERITALSQGRKGNACAAAIELLDAMSRLRGPQRRLAVRLMLQGGRDG